MSRKRKFNQHGKQFEELEKRMFLTGNGNFNSFPIIETAATESVSLLADLDGDGTDDMIGGDNLNAWFRNDRSASSLSLRSPIIYLQSGEHEVLDHLAADFDGDGDEDIVATIRGNRAVGRFPLAALYIYENIDGQFPNRRHIGLEKGGGHPRSIERISVGDLDGDGDFDILSSYYYADLSRSCTNGWLENTDGNADFEFHLIETRSWDSFDDHPSLYCKTPLSHDFDGDSQVQIPAVSSRNFHSTADIDGDGDRDVLEQKNRYGDWVWHRNDNGTLVEQSLPADQNDRLTAFDADNDNDIDLVIVNGKKLSWYENVLGDASEFSLRSTEIELRGELLIGDVNGDGRDDLFDANADGNKFAWFRFADRQSELQVETLTQKFSSNFELMELADLDSDGAVDLIGNDGWYTFADANSTVVAHPYPENVSPESIVHFDFDADGDLDLIAKVNRQIGVFEMASDRLLPFRSLATIGRLDSFELFDFDADGHADILVKSTRSLEWLKKNTDGSFDDPIKLLTIPRNADYIFGDLSGDGMDDIVVFDTGPQGKTSWYERDGLSFKEPVVIRASPTISAAAGDFNGDGSIDVLIASVISFDSVYFTVFENDGAGGFSLDTQTWIGYLYGSTSLEMTVVDLDKDGDLDIVGTNTRPSAFAAPEGQVFWIQNEGDGSLQRPRLILKGIVNPRIFIADVDGDGDTDIVSSVGRVPAVTIHEQVFRPSGDFDRDGTVGTADIDLLCRDFYSTSEYSEFDLNSDYRVEKKDLDYVVKTILGTTHGDVNLDGKFDSADLVAIFVAGEYEDDSHRNSTWSTGDINCDGAFDSADLRLMFAEGDFVFASTPRRATASIAASILGNEALNTPLRKKK